MKITVGEKAAAAVISMVLLACCFQVMEGKAQEAENTGEAEQITSAQVTEESGDTSVNLQGSLMMLTEDVGAREEPRESAAVVVELPQGSQLLVTGEDNGWYQIFYQGKTAYVPSDAAVASTEVDQEALDQEMQKAEEEGAAFVESLETQRTAAQRSRIWQIVIIVLIVAVFLTGVVSAVKSSKADKGKETKEKNGHEQ
ncbi:MAG TPA: SH3 domain-containing protein [Candidatus Eisenbergiella merdipullorum]|uniref:SH3 domain-containing protein n=1 Tax=Candidatus Eisenbergiella merdipullorum TaxID=2838553 RepID=A0A9D2I4L7_9FIRM|nr:SH3 domain-containing protein [Candidatus Eisenbergiella merdipullorum]